VVAVVYMSPIRLFDLASKQTRILLVGGSRYVVKEYESEPGVIKWYAVVAANMAIKIYPFTQSPFERLEREVSFLRQGFKCFKKPALHVVDYVSLKTIREFVRGDPYSSKAPPHIHSTIGRCLAECHERGWSLGDTKISNFIYSDFEVYVVDAEQAVNEHNPRYGAWDLLILASTLAIDIYPSLRYNNYSRIIGEVLRGYGEQGGVAESVLKQLEEPDFKILSYILIPFPLNVIFAKRLEEVKRDLRR
jgi:tRNA A-37 threonylcarbamoyl transferase component Bud32